MTIEEQYTKMLKKSL